MQSVQGTLHEQLHEWVQFNSQNGILQHSAEWLDAKRYTIGGSSMATVQGKNPYADEYKLISDKIGLTKFTGDIKTQWGNLFEELIKQYVERDRTCTVLGEDMYIVGKNPNISYSPDGLSVMDVNGMQQIALLEFKCPYSRMPTGKMPNYYIPQVKMGLDMLELPSVGVFAEAVFRRCALNQYNNTPDYDVSLKQKSTGKPPIAMGIIGMATNRDRVSDLYEQEYGEYGNRDNGYMCNDLGCASPELFTEIMDDYNSGSVSVHYFPIGGDPAEDMKTWETLCRQRGLNSVGLLPWKLFKIDYHVIEKTPNYIEPWLEKINDILSVVRKCMLPENAHKKSKIHSDYVCARTGGGFIE